MNFSSIKEYFYKLYNLCYLLLLLPLGIFIFIYYQLHEDKIVPVVQDELHILLLAGGAFILVLANLTTVHWLAGRRLKKYARLPGLGLKLDHYYEIIFLRFASGAISSLLLAIGLMLTESEYFPYIFVLVLAVMATQWPTSRKACRELKLRGDEYTMVMDKKDSF